MQGHLWEDRAPCNPLYDQTAMDLKRDRLTVARRGWEVGKVKARRASWATIRSLDFMLQAEKAIESFKQEDMIGRSFEQASGRRFLERSRVDAGKPVRKVSHDIVLIKVSGGPTPELYSQPACISSVALPLTSCGQNF